MKKRFYLQGLLMVISFLLIFILCSQIESTYKRNAKVVSVDQEVVTFEDETGNFWEWERETNEREYKTNEKVKLIMFNNHTDNKVEDDEIKRVKRGV